MVSYTNKKGKEVQITVTKHAFGQFSKRYRAIFPDKELKRDDVASTIRQYFANASRIKNLNKWEKARLKRYGKDTMYFRTSGLTFVVQNATMLTVEISDKNMRHLNKRKII